MKINSLKSFSIYGLFGTDDVHIPLEEPVKILIGENGLGKTQVLNIFYYTLQRDFDKLADFPFERIELKFNDNDTVKFSKDDILESMENYFKDSTPMLEAVFSTMDKIQAKHLMREIKYRNRTRVISILSHNQIAQKLDIPNEHLTDIFISRERNNKKELLNTNLTNCKNKLDELIESNKAILYFPTYRRVEEDLHNLGYEEAGFGLSTETSLIQFGMADVQKRFQSIENNIDKLLKDGLAQFTRDILNVVIDETTPDPNLLEKINADDLDIILSRVGNQLQPSQKEAVRNIVSNKQIKNPLSAYLLQKLIDIYEKQKEIDASVKKFRDICNHYLIKKQVFYDESAIKIYIKSHITEQAIELSKLSSGEKQIISIFSRIYLSDETQRFMVLFDEPELSLSMLWQKQLLPDVLASNKCDFLMAVTHSPFIFDNALDKYAVGLNEYISISAVENNFL